MGKSEHLDTVGGNVKWCSVMNNSMEVPQKIKIKNTKWSWYLLGGMTQIFIPNSSRLLVFLT